MLVLSRLVNESIIIGDNIEVTIVEIRGNKVRLGFEAPRNIEIFRKEIWLEKLNEDNREGIPDKSGIIQPRA